MTRIHDVLFPCLLWTLTATLLQAHPIPDIPVRAAFDEGGKAVIVVEVDPRCFEEDPNTAPSVWKAELDTMPEEKQQALQDKARDYIARTAAFDFKPTGRLTPAFTFALTGQAGQPLVKNDDVVVVTGTWSPELPADTKGYQLHALPEGKLSVLFLNKLRGQDVERIQVLFPGESSYVLPLTEPKEAALPNATKPGGSSNGLWAVVVAALAAGGVWWGSRP